MLYNHFKISIRNIKKNKSITSINVIGLTTGILVCLIIIQYVFYEQSYDKHHEYADIVYRIERDPFCTIAPSWVPILKDNFKEIEEVARITPPWEVVVKSNEKTFQEKNLCFAEAKIFDILSFDFIYGDQKTALQAINQCVISKSIANKYFGDINPIGQQLNFNGQIAASVIGVYADFPENSHLKCDFICSYISLRDKSVPLYDDYFLGYNNFKDNVTLAYAKFSKKVNMEEFKSELPAFIDKNFPKEDYNGSNNRPMHASKITFRKITDIHLHSHKSNEISTNSDIKYIYIFSTLALLILTIACLNFFNLSTATIENRFREIGMKKVFGITKKSVYAQFFAEAFILVVFSSIIAVTLNYLLLPYLKSFLLIKPATQMLNPGFLVGALLIIVVILSLITGFVPGKYFSGLKILHIIRKNPIGSSKKYSYRNVLVVFQFTIAIGLFVCIATIHSQVNYFFNKNLGYEKENILLIPVNNETREKWDNIRLELLSNPKIENVCLSKNTIGGRLLDDPGLEIYMDNEWKPWPGTIPHIRTDHHFFDTYGIDIVAGRDFNPHISREKETEFILNEAAVKRLEIFTKEEIIGKSIRYNNRIGKVIGIAEDYHYESLHNQIKPTVTYVQKGSANVLSIKISGNNYKEAVPDIEEILSRHHTSYEFTYQFFDEKLQNQYVGEKNMKTILNFSFILAAFIAGLGLFGLSLFSIEKRIKEIGVRKVNGAKTKEILFMLNTDFIKWIAVALVIACPIAYYAMTKWLENFAYKTDISWWIFIASGGIALFIALITVSWQSWRAASRNPVEALRYE